MSDSSTHATTMALEDPHWLYFPACPSCGSHGNIVGRLGINRYPGIPPQAAHPVVSICRCGHCGLVYKDIILSPDYLSELTAMHEAEYWSAPYTYKPELEILDKAADRQDYDLLDIGAANGALFLALVNRVGRHSALDIFQFANLKITSGEFIKGFLDERELNWSGLPYDVVTVFDVMEHLYSPNDAMNNLRMFTKLGGLVAIETGNADWIAEAELTKWTYLGYYQHHMAWNARSLSHLASKHGFQVVSVTQKRHKLALPKRFSLRDFVKRKFYLIFPALFQLVHKWAGRDAYIPDDVHDVDHMLVLLRRES